MIIKRIDIGHIKNNIWFSSDDYTYNKTEEFIPTDVNIDIGYPRRSLPDGVVKIEGSVHKSWEAVKNMSLQELNELMRKETEESVSRISERGKCQ